MSKVIRDRSFAGKPVITSHLDDITKHDWYNSMTSAANAMGVTVSTISRAASGDRGILTSRNRIVSYA